MLQSTVENISKSLQDKGVSPSIQRIKILQFILENEHHSSVDSIYQNLIFEIPTLSKTTVYNTLSLFVDKKLINTINISNGEILYEQSQKPHAHFHCEICNQVKDIDIDSSLFELKEIEKHKVEKVNIHLKGTCESCLNIN
jgi:Fur family peroxide stress response transcriptional regulator